MDTAPEQAPDTPPADQKKADLGKRLIAALIDGILAARPEKLDPALPEAAGVGDHSTAHLLGVRHQLTVVELDCGRIESIDIGVAHEGDEVVEHIHFHLGHRERIVIPHRREQIPVDLPRRRHGEHEQRAIRAQACSVRL